MQEVSVATRRTFAPYGCGEPPSLTVIIEGEASRCIQIISVVNSRVDPPSSGNDQLTSRSFKPRPNDNPRLSLGHVCFPGNIRDSVIAC